MQAIRHDYPSLQVALCLQASSTAQAAVKSADIICTWVLKLRQHRGPRRSQTTAAVSRRLGQSLTRTTCRSKCTSQPVRAVILKAIALPLTRRTTVGSYKPDMHEFPASLIAPSSGRVKRILVDSRSACLAEAGEIISSGIARVPENLVEIGSVVDAEGRANAHCDEFRSGSGGVTLFKSVGVGAMDVAIATLVFESAHALRLGMDIDYE